MHVNYWVLFIATLKSRKDNDVFKRLWLRINENEHLV